MSPTETDDEKAVRLLTRQLEEVKDIRPLNWRHPKFKAWRDTTMTVLEKFVGPNSTYLSTYRNLRFFEPPRMITVGFGGPPPPPPDYVSPEDAAAYQGACETSEETLRAAIRHIKDFGVYVEHLQAVSSRRGKAGSTGHGGGQHFYGPIKNVAIAADNAAQNIGQVGDSTGASLKEIGELFQESMDLTRRQMQEGLAGIENLAVEVQKPEKSRNWKVVLDCGEKVLEIARKATDLASKLAPYTPAIVVLVEQARHMLG